MSAPEHVYVHVPFCRRRCVYCDFSIAVRATVPSERFADAILAELAVRAPALGPPPERLQTIYFGGGTPSLLGTAALGRIMQGIVQWSASDGADEVTLEANPEDVTHERARAWRALGVTRVSLGVQSFEDPVLQWMHRSHNADAVPRAVEAIRAAGIASLSLDLIIGVPVEVGPDTARDRLRAMELEPDHLSVYTLTFEPSAPLGKWEAWGRIAPASDARYAAEFLVTHEVLTDAGYEHYEVSNYARPGRRSVHNAAYWSNRNYLGLGPSAHSRQGDTRSWNLDPWVQYERAVASGQSCEGNAERLTEAQRRLERTYLGLRHVDGLPMEQVAWRSEVGKGTLRFGWAEITDGRFRLTPEGWLRLDELAGALTTDTEGG